MLKITEINLIPVRNINGLTFFANFVLDNRFYIGNVALFSRLDRPGFRCVYPTKVFQNGKQTPIIYPINKSVGREIEDVLSTEANRLLNSPENRLVGRYIFGRGKKDES